MDGTTATLCASALLLVVASLPTGAREGSIRVWTTVVLYLASVCLTATAFGAFLHFIRYVPDTLATSLALYGAEELSHATEKNVILLDGGSYPARGIDDRVLAKELSSRGYSVRIVHLAMSAGNHFERYSMYRDLLDDVREHRGEHWIYLAEVHAGYDKSPFAQLERNQNTARAYHYMTPANAWFGLEATYLGGGTRVAVRNLPWTVLRHAMVQAFNFGAFSYLVPAQKVRSTSGYIPGVREPRFKFSGLASAIGAVAASTADVQVPAWSFDVRERRERRLWASFIDAWVYYGVPATTGLTSLFIRKHCAQTKLPCIAPDEGLLRTLDSPDDWYNAGHLSSRGAVMYSRWLAARLVEQGVLRR